MCVKCSPTAWPGSVSRYHNYSYLSGLGAAGAGPENSSHVESGFPQQKPGKHGGVRIPQKMERLAIPFQKMQNSLQNRSQPLWVSQQPGRLCGGLAQGQKLGPMTLRKGRAREGEGVPAQD